MGCGMMWYDKRFGMGYVMCCDKKCNMVCVISIVLTFRWSIIYVPCFVFCIRHHLCGVVYASTLCIVTPFYAILHHSSRFVY